MNALVMEVTPRSQGQIKAYLALREYVEERFMIDPAYKDLTVTIDSIEYVKPSGARPRMWVFQGKVEWHELHNEPYFPGVGWHRHESTFSMNITSQGVADYMARKFGK